MRILKRVAIVLVSLCVLLVIINYGASYYISEKLPSILKAEKGFPYLINYNDLDVNIISGSFTMRRATLQPKDSIKATVKNGIYGDIKSIQVSGLSLWQLIKNNRIVVSSVTLDAPNIILYHRDKKYNVESDIEKPFKQVVQTGSVEIINGDFRMLDVKQHPLLKAKNINFAVFKIKVDSATVKENVPVRYRDYRFACDSFYYNAGEFYNITLNKIKSTDSTLTIDNFRMIPKQTRKQFVAMMAKEKDQFNLQADTISIPKLDWGFVNDTLYVHTPQMVLQKVHANVYRSKEPKDDLTRKKLYSEMLRSIKFDLKVDKLLLKNSLVEYEEQIDFSKPAAKVIFSKFYATVSRVYSPIAKAKLPNTTIDVQCLFMKAAPLSVNWSFNTLDKSDSFTIIGHLQNLSSKLANPISKPLMNATTDGTIKDLRFVFNGNRVRSTGTFAIEYEDLKVGIYNKDGKKKNKLISAVANLVVKNDSDDKLKKVNVAVERKQDKSVFNFLWNFVMQGLKQTILPKIVT